MATMASLRARLRLELSDLKLPIYETHTVPSTGIIDLRRERIDTVYVYPEGDPDDLLTDYTVDAMQGRIIFAADARPEVGTVLVVEGESSDLFTDEDLDIFLESAFGKHTMAHNPRPTMASLPPVEDHLVVLLAKVESLWVLITSAAFDVNIHAPEGVFVPRGQRFNQLRELLAMTESYYRELSNALGVGLYAVQMFTLRRVSRLTGRYVPVYLDQEVDDTRPKQRVFPNISAQGAEMPVNSVPTYNLHVFQGRPFEETYSLQEEDGSPLDIAGTSFEAHLYRSKHSTTSHRDVLPDLSVSVNEDESEVTISLTADEAKHLETTGAYVWDLRWINDPVNDPEGIVLLSGRILVESSYPVKNTNVQVTR